MFYLLYGSDTYRREERLAALRAAYRKKNPRALGETVLDGSVELAAVRAALASGGGLFEQKRFIVVRDAFAAHGTDLLAFCKEAKSMGRSDLNIVFVEGDIETKGGLRELSAYCRSDVFRDLSHAQLQRWIGSYVAQHGPENGPKRVAPQATAMLSALGPDLWRVSNELEKLIAYTAGRAVILEEDVRRLVNFVEGGAVYEVADSVGARDPIAALVSVARLTANGRGAEGIASYVVSETRNLVYAHAANDAPLAQRDAAAAGAKPFVWRKRLAQARRFSGEEVRTLLALALKLDVAWKSGADARLALERFILTVPVSQGKARREY